MRIPRTLVVLAALILCARPTVADPWASARAKSMDNVRTLLLYYTYSGAGLERSWPGYNGKDFVLSLIATNKISKNDDKQLEIRFSPADERRSVAQAGGAAAYAGIGKSVLSDGKVDLSALTSYVGPRRARPSMTAAEKALGAPMIADLSFTDGAIVGFADGRVKWLTRAELGLARYDPIAAGDASKSPILRMLSAE